MAVIKSAEAQTRKQFEQRRIEKIPAAKLIGKLPWGGLALTTGESILKWGKASSLWPMTFGLACCAFEMIAAGASRFDIDRFGAGVFRASPRQCDVMIVSGTICVKMGDCIRRLYAQMPEPKYVIAMGNCAISGGIFYHDTYSVVKGAESLGIPVDVFVPGCPPRPENLLFGLMKLQEKIKREKNAAR